MGMVSFQHHYSSLQCHVILQKYVDLVFNHYQLLLVFSY